ncbi:CAP domain-containing protein [Patescibacteria group bacterium]
MRTIKILVIFSLLIIPVCTQASLASDLNGMILLQVQANGEAWYVYPENLQRYYLGRPSDAFNIMRELGLGIAHAELEQYLDSYFPKRLTGKILLDVQANGEAYYIYPKDLNGYYLGRPGDAFNIMRELGLGITNNDLNKILISSTSDKSEVVEPINNNQQISDYSEIEQRTFQLINQHRLSIGVPALDWHEEIAIPCRDHSNNMAQGIIEPSHQDFDLRVAQIKTKIPKYNGGAENLAWNYNYADPAQQALNWWLTSPGHKASLENDFYDLTGIGVSKSTDGKYFLTQIFININ